MTDIKYELIRSSRKTICIIIYNNKVIVRAPLGTSVDKIENFIYKKREWIIKKLSADNVYNDLCGYNYVYVKGEKVPLVFGDLNSFEEDIVIVKKLADLKKLYINNFGKEFLNIFDSVSQASGLNANSVSFKDYKARWGCCDSKKHIVFNYKLLMLPMVLWQCVIVHELCHTVFMDHSKNFHKLAESIMPGYKAVHCRLKKYGAVTRLY